MKKLQTVIKKLIVTFWSVIHSLRELLTFHMKMCWLVYSKISAVMHSSIQFNFQSSFIYIMPKHNNGHHKTLNTVR